MIRTRVVCVLLVPVIALVAIGVASVGVFYGWRASSPPLPPGIPRSMYDAAARAFRDHYRQEPDHYDVLSCLGEALAEQEQIAAAIVCLEGIPSDHAKYGHLARFQQAYHFAKLNRASQSEGKIREFLQLERARPQLTRRHYLEGLNLLRFLLETELRFEERQKVFREIQALGVVETFDVMASCFPSLLRWNGPEAISWHEKFWKTDPNDFWLRVAAGRYRMGQGEADEAQKILDQCCRERPENLWAQAAYLDILREQGDWEAIAATCQRLPPRSADEPWLLMRMRGHDHNQGRRYEEALRCFQTALEADPANAESYLGLAKAYEGLQRPADRQRALDKSNVLARIQNRLGWVMFHEKDIEPMIEIADLCLQIGLDDSAQKVAHLVQRIDPEHPRGQELRARIDAKPKS